MSVQKPVTQRASVLLGELLAHFSVHDYILKDQPFSYGTSMPIYAKTCIFHAEFCNIPHTGT